MNNVLGCISKRVTRTVRKLTNRRCGFIGFEPRRDAAPAYIYSVGASITTCIF